METEAVINSSDSSAVVVEVTKPAGHVTAPGVCPVKPEYLRTQLQRQTLETDGKTRGMNKGSERLHTENVAGTERPTFEGESNFLNGETLTKVKIALRNKGAPRNDENKRLRDDESATTVAAPTEESSVAPVPELPVAKDSTPAETTAVSAPSIAREVAAAQVIPVKVTPDDIRARQAKARHMFSNRCILAPLTTVGNLPYRRICKGFGADNTVSEMAMIYNLNKTQKSEWSLLRRHASEDVFGIQVAVSRPDDALQFAKAIEASGFSYDYIDINCGCPVDLIVKQGCGCGLWEKKGRFREVVKMLTAYQSKPVTIKCRIGENEAAPTLHNQIAEYSEWGASAVTIHGRSKRQRYTKLANWEYVERCAKLTSLPVIGNGDIFSWEDVQEHLQHCPTVGSHLIARGALIKPWIFDEIKNQRSWDISSHERFEMLKQFVSHGLAHWGADEKGVIATRRFLCEWLSFLYRYVPIALLERLPQKMNERPPLYEGRDDLETLFSSDSVVDWVRITELLLGPAGDKFVFTAKHKSNSYAPSALATSAEPAAPEVEG